MWLFRRRYWNDEITTDEVSRTFSTRDTGQECIQNLGRCIHKMKNIVTVHCKGKRVGNCGIDWTGSGRAFVSKAMNLLVP